MNQQAWAHQRKARSLDLAEMFWALRDHDPELDDRSHAPFRAAAEREGEPVLLIGADSGGLLLSLLRDGLDVEAVEPSATVRTYLLRLALERKQHLTLYAVSMEHMDLDRRYATILVPCGLMALLTDRRRVLRVLARLYRHLRPGGALTFNIELPTALLSASSSPLMNAPGKPIALDSSNGESLLSERRFLGLDPVDQIYAEQRIYKLYRGRRLVRQEYRTVRGRWYSRHEMAMMLAWTGFGEIDVAGVGPDFSRPTRADQVSRLIFTARK